MPRRLPEKTKTIDRRPKVQGYLIFVPQARIGERFKAKIVRTERKCAIAEKITV